MEHEDVVNELPGFIARLTLVSVRCTRLLAATATEELIVPYTATVTIAETIHYALGDEFLGGKYPATVVLRGDSGQEVARVETTFLLEHTLESGPSPDEKVVSAYLNANGLFIAYPYIRQALHDALNRIGYGQLVLGILSRDDVAPIVIEAPLLEGEQDEQESSPVG